MNSDPSFSRFLNALCNDFTFLLDEALKSLTQVREGQRQRADPAWAQRPAAEREEVGSPLVLSLATQL
jgi:hypothetical protein